MITKLGQYLPDSLKPLAIKLYYFDASRQILNDDEELLPPQKLMSSTKQEFIKLGQATLEQLIRIGGLEPDHNILDVGCGSGRIAIPLTNYMNEKGSYEGFDPMPYGVKWCSANISPRFPNFHFTTIDLYNKMYNPSGKIKPPEFRFPFNDSSFDFVLLNSVFTHILREGLENYLSEIARVLKPNGKSFITFFLLNNNTAQLIEKGKSIFKFGYKEDNNCYLDDPKNPEIAVAYEEDFIRRLYKANSLEIVEPIYFGTWRKGVHSITFQDVIVSIRKL